MGKNTLSELRKNGSLNHGFASYAGVALAYGMAGISNILYSEKKIYLEEKYLSCIDYSLDIHTEDGPIQIQEKSGKKKISIPDNWIIF